MAGSGHTLEEEEEEGIGCLENAQRGVLPAGIVLLIKPVCWCPEICFPPGIRRGRNAHRTTFTPGLGKIRLHSGSTRRRRRRKSRKRG